MTSNKVVEITIDECHDAELSEGTIVEIDESHDVGMLELLPHGDFVLDSHFHYVVLVICILSQLLAHDLYCIRDPFTCFNGVRLLDNAEAARADLPSEYVLTVIPNLSPFVVWLYRNIIVNMTEARQKGAGWRH